MASGHPAPPPSPSPSLPAASSRIDAALACPPPPPPCASWHSVPSWRLMFASPLLARSRPERGGRCDSCKGERRDGHEGKRRPTADTVTTKRPQPRRHRRRRGCLVGCSGGGMQWRMEGGANRGGGGAAGRRISLSTLFLDPLWLLFTEESVGRCAVGGGGGGEQMEHSWRGTPSDDELPSGGGERTPHRPPLPGRTLPADVAVGRVFPVPAAAAAAPTAVAAPRGRNGGGLAGCRRRASSTPLRRSSSCPPGARACADGSAAATRGHYRLLRWFPCCSCLGSVRGGPHPPNWGSEATERATLDWRWWWWSSTPAWGGRGQLRPGRTGGGQWG